MQPDITWTEAAAMFGFCTALFGGFWLLDVLYDLGNRMDDMTPPDRGDDVLPPLRVPPAPEMNRILRLRDRRFRSHRRRGA